MTYKKKKTLHFETNDEHEKLSKFIALQCNKLTKLSLALKPLDLYANFLRLFVAYLEPFNLVHKCLNWLLQISKPSYTVKKLRSKCGVNLVIWSECGVGDL
jgi:hypothetical protein